MSKTPELEIWSTLTPAALDTGFANQHRKGKEECKTLALDEEKPLYEAGFTALQDKSEC